MGRCRRPLILRSPSPAPAPSVPCAPRPLRAAPPAPPAPLAPPTPRAPRPAPLRIAPDASQRQFGGQFSEQFPGRRRYHGHFLRQFLRDDFSSIHVVFYRRNQFSENWRVNWRINWRVNWRINWRINWRLNWRRILFAGLLGFAPSDTDFMLRPPPSRGPASAPFRPDRLYNTPPSPRSGVRTEYYLVL